MNNKGCFVNPYHNITSSTALNILSDKRDSISDKFQDKLGKFKSEKILHLTSNLEKDIFYDGTVYTGSTGIALLYLKDSFNKNECPEFLQKALGYIDIKHLKGRRLSFLCGDAGPLAIAIVISYKLGTKRPECLPEPQHLVQRLIKLSSMLDSSPDELLYGKSGYLYALLFVNKYTSRDVIPENNIKKVIEAILKSGKLGAHRMKSESPLMWEWHDKQYLGAAHGVAGILYMLLQARCYIQSDNMQTFIKPTLDWLLIQRFSSGNFPSSLESKSRDRLVQWCHGAPGFVPLCVLAYKVFEDERYLNIAEECGEVVWQRGLCSKGYSICHGVSGNAYAFLELYQATMKPLHLYRACCFMEWCMSERTGTEMHPPDRPASLFEGVVGRIYLAMDITHPLDAKFPAMCL